MRYDKKGVRFAAQHLAVESPCCRAELQTSFEDSAGRRAAHNRCICVSINRRVLLTVVRRALEWTWAFTWLAGGQDLAARCSVRRRVQGQRPARQGEQPDTAADRAGFVCARPRLASMTCMQHTCAHDMEVSTDKFTYIQQRARKLHVR